MKLDKMSWVGFRDLTAYRHTNVPHHPLPFL